MTIKHVPAQDYVECDGCGAEGKHGRAPFLKNAHLKLHRSALDRDNYPAADASFAADLCDACETKVSAAINKAIEEVRPS